MKLKQIVIFLKYIIFMYPHDFHISMDWETGKEDTYIFYISV